jgi:hypothetical protein
MPALRGKNMSINTRKKFHVDHDVRPVHVIAVLKQMSPFVGDVRTQLLADLAANDYKISSHYLFWNLKVLRTLGLTDVDEKTESWRLTRRGVYLRALAAWNQQTFIDMMHYLYYAAWDFGDREAASFSWTYRTVTNLLWQRRPTVIDGKGLAAEVRDLACKEFGLESVSITDYAVDGVYNWLRGLDPAFAWTDTKSRRRETNGGRASCTPELFLMAVDYLYRSKDIAYDRPLVMDDDKINVICRLCLLDPLKWKSVLNRTIEQFTILRRMGSANGPQLTLERSPRLIVWEPEAELEPVDLESFGEPERPRTADEADDLDDEDEEGGG